MGKPPSAQPTPSNDFSDPWSVEREWDMRHRLAAVGATVDEIEAFCEQWIHDPTWDHADKERLYALGDGKLRAEVLSARDDGYRDTETDADEVARLADEAHAAKQAKMRADAAEMSAYEPEQIIGWVGQDVPRARAMLAVEEAHPHARAGLIAALLRVVDDGMRRGS